MKADEFLGAVRERGEYTDRAEAEQVSRTVLSVLGQRLAGGEPRSLAAQLPVELQDALPQNERPGESFGVSEFLERVAAVLNSTVESARWDTSAVLSTVADAVTGGELNKVLTQLQPAYAALFGKPELSS